MPAKQRMKRQMNNTAHEIKKYLRCEEGEKETGRKINREGRQRSEHLHHLLTVVPLGKKGVEGGEVNFCTWQKISCCVPLGGREKRQREIEGESIRKMRRTSKVLCLSGWGERGDGRSAEETERSKCVKEGVWEEVRIKKQRIQKEERKGGEPSHLFMQT